MNNREPSLAAARFAAATLVSRYGIESPDDIQLENIAWLMKIRIKIARIAGAEAWLLRDGNKGLIRISDRIREPGRRRFAIGHELGHWECHINQSQVWLCTSEDIHSYLGSTAEIEANTFSSHLLMPKLLLAPRLSGKHLSLNLFCELAEEFNTTLTATAMRVMEEVRDDCCVVFSRGNTVLWWKPSTTSSFGLPSRFAVSSESRAFDCTREPGKTPGPQQVDAAAWIPNRRGGVEVWEEAILLGDYGTVLTLLCFD